MARQRHVLLLCPDDSSSLETEWSDWEKREFDALLAALQSLPRTRVTVRRDHMELFLSLLAGREDRDKDEDIVVFNLLQEGVFNDPAFEAHVSAVLDLARVAYTGAGVASLVSSLDKNIMAAVARSRGVKVPESSVIAAGDDVEARVSASPPQRYPVLVKLSNAYSSLGMDEDPLCADLDEVVRKAQSLRERFPQFGVLAQEYLPGREFSVAVVGNESTGTLRVLPILEVDFSALKSSGKVPVQSYEQRLDNDSELNRGGPIRVSEENLPRATIEAIEDCARTMFVAIGARDYARFDVRLGIDGETPYVIDANPNCWIGGKMVTMAEWAGLGVTGLVQLIVDEAFSRGADK